MKKLTLLFLFAGFGFAAEGQQVRSDTVLLPVYAPLETEQAAELPDEEDYSGYFMPAITGNGNYLPVGQLSRNLIGVRFRPRGYDNRYLRHEVNGAELSDPSDGFPYWSILSSINLLARTHNDVSGLTPGPFALGGMGGITSISTTDKHTQGRNRISYAHTNRSYQHRLSFAGRDVSSRGWVTSLGGSARMGKDGFVDGVFSNQLNLAGSLHKYFGDYAVSLLIAMTDSKQGVRSGATQEVYDLAETNYYNPNWGYQNGKLRNNKERGYRQYFSVLSVQGVLNERWTVQAALSVFGGENSFSLLTWYDAPTPYADYYRSLPDFFANPEVGNALRQEWQAGNTNITQINWRKLYEANRYNTDENGISRSHYVIRDLVTDKLNTQFTASLAYRHNKNLTVRGGFSFRSDRADNFARLNDLLGGGYWLDIDQYLLDDEYYGGMYQNDVRNPNRPVFEGEKFGYDYRMLSNNLKAWGTVNYQSLKWEAFAGLELSALTFQREGRYEKEMFPGNQSFGRSDKINFPEYALKGGVSYHFTLRHRIGIRGMIGETAPLVKGLFVSPSYRNEVVRDWQSVQMTSGEVVYQWMTPQFKFDLTGYLSLFKGDSEIRNFYDDIEGEYLNLVLSGINKIHGGVEAGAEWAVTPRFSLLGVLAWNVYKYDNDPTVTLYRDNDGQILLSGAKSYLSGYRLSGTPQTAGMLQLNYRTRSYWRFELSAKYTGHNYVSISPVRRMTRTLDLAGSPEMRREMLAQERLDDAFMVALSVSKNFRLRNGNSIGLWINADNLFNNRSIRYSGYEQMRFSRTSEGAGRTLVPFPSKYYYAYGTNYYVLISYTF